MIKIPSTDDFIFSVKCFLGAMLALYLAQRIGLPRPFWAPLTAYVVSQPLAGAVRSKAIYRFIGTFIGAMAIAIIIPTFINYTILFALVIGAWFAICLYISLMDRTPRSYAFLLGGYTVGLVAMPSLIDMTTFSVESIIELSVARAEEIFLGVTCASLVHSIILPKGVGSVVITRLDQLLKNGQTWAQSALNISNEPTKTQDAFDLTKLSVAITELRIMSTHLLYDTTNAKWVNNLIRSMQDRLSVLVPILSAIEDRLTAITENKTVPLPENWQTLLNDIASWIARGAAGNEPIYAVRLRHRIDAIVPTITQNTTWREMLYAALANELYRLVDASENCFAIRRRINIGLRGEIPENEDKGIKVSTRNLYVDKTLSLGSAIAAGLAMTVTTIFWAVSGWPSGFAAPMMAGMYCMFFATFDSPVPVLKIQFYNTLLSSPVTGIYLLWLLPSAHSMEMMMLMWAPFLLWFGAYLATPMGALKTIPFMFTVLANMMMFDLGSANMTAYFNAQISQAIGVGAAALFMGIFRSVSIDSIIRRLVKSIWDDISRLGYSIKMPAIMAVTVKMVDGISLLAPRLAVASKTGGTQSENYIAATHILSDLRVGLNMTRLLRSIDKLGDETLRPILHRLSNYYAYEKKFDDVSKQNLLKRIDDALFKVAGMPADFHQRHVVAILTSIRRDLFPNASPYQVQDKVKKMTNLIDKIN